MLAVFEVLSTIVIGSTRCMLAARGLEHDCHRLYLSNQVCLVTHTRCTLAVFRGLEHDCHRLYLLDQVCLVTHTRCMLAARGLEHDCHRLYLLRRAVEVLSAIDIGFIPLDQVFHHLWFV
jgi:lysylphosphatidylglycerol synthetase-like protein (DUF2156 family)